MAAPNSGPGARKFTDDDVLAAFDEEQRRSVGKIELSAKEVTEILNEQILPEETAVTRQAVDKRLKEMVGDKLARAQHGRSYLYRRPDDIDRLFRPEVADTGPAPGGKGGLPSDDYAPESSTETRDRETVEEIETKVVTDGGVELFSRFLPPLAAVTIAASLGFLITGTTGIATWVFGSISVATLLTVLAGGDRRLDGYVATAKGVLRTTGLHGGIEKIREKIRDDHPAPNNPQTLVERIAWWDLKSFKLVPLLFIYFGSIALAVNTYGAEAVVNTLTPNGVILVLGIGMILMYAWPLSLILSSSALLSIESDRLESSSKAGYRGVEE